MLGADSYSLLQQSRCSGCNPLAHNGNGLISRMIKDILSDFETHTAPSHYVCTLNTFPVGVPAVGKEVVDGAYFFVFERVF